VEVVGRSVGNMIKVGSGSEVLVLEAVIVASGPAGRHCAMVAVVAIVGVLL